MLLTITKFGTISSACQDLFIRVIGESFLCEEDDFGADHITIRCVYFLAIDSSVCRSSLERFTLNGLFFGIRDPIALMQAYQITSPIRLSKYVIVFPNSCTKLD